MLLYLLAILPVSQTHSGHTAMSTYLISSLILRKIIPPFLVSHLPTVFYIVSHIIIKFNEDYLHLFCDCIVLLLLETCSQN